MSELITSEDHPTPDLAQESSSTYSGKPQRILACTLCQQRKVKCNRKFPCSNCVKSRAKCVPATLTNRQRRRRFPERELLERLRRYEDLLRQHNIKFTPLHKDDPDIEDQLDKQDEFLEDEQIDEGQSKSTPGVKSGGDGYTIKNRWHALSQGFRDNDNDSDSSHDDVREKIIRTAWDQAIENDDHLLFGSRKSAVELSTLHPDPVQIFRLWQLYLDNVNPVLKVTHTPSLQSKVIEVAGNVKTVDRTLEALMFSIYCTATTSLSADECLTFFGSSKEDLLMKYQFGCQQALLNCTFLRCNDRECLTALFLYLVSVTPSAIPQSVSSMFGVAIRIAKRMGINNESMLSKCTPFEAEMRRRLWWAIVVFDNRISDLANSKTTDLDPTWDCHIPLNINDSDLRPDMKEPPQSQANPTESIFAVIRCKVGDFLRHSVFHLDLNLPSLKPLARTNNDSQIDMLNKLEQSLEEHYLKADPDNPINFITMWTTRTQVAKGRLMEHHSRFFNSNTRRTEAQREAATSYAMRILECDTKIMTSPLTKRFIWYNQFFFPFPGYIHLVQDLRKRPLSDQAIRAWEAMSENYDAWCLSCFNQFRNGKPFFIIFTNLILQAWKAYEAALKQAGKDTTPPRIVAFIKETLAKDALPNGEGIQMDGGMDVDFGVDLGVGMGFNDSPGSLSSGHADYSLPYTMGMQFAYMGANPGMFAGGPGSIPYHSNPNLNANQLDWSGMGGPSTLAGW